VEVTAMAGKYDEQADDWEIACVGNIAGADFVGGGLWAFLLRSDDLGITEKMTFMATGLGMGGNASGFSPTGVSYDPVDADAPFSIRQVHLSSGRLLSSAAGVSKASYGVSAIDSVKSGVTFFKYASKGASLGSGAGVLAFVGTWYSFVLNNNSVNPVTAYIDGAKQAYQDIVDTWSRGFQNLYPH
jgi:hypothetical protein